MIIYAEVMDIPGGILSDGVNGMDGCCQWGGGGAGGGIMLVGHDITLSGTLQAGDLSFDTGDSIDFGPGSSGVLLVLNSAVDVAAAEAFIAAGNLTTMSAAGLEASVIDVGGVADEQISPGLGLPRLLPVLFSNGIKGDLLIVE